MVSRRNVWLIFSSSVMPMPPWSWTASWLTCRQASATLILAAETARARSAGGGAVHLHARQARHGARLLVADHHVHHAVLERLEAADRHPELPARLQVLERGLVGVADGAHRLRAEQRGGVVGRVLDQRQRAAFLAQQRVGGHASRR